jgi:hypothetical protein
MRWGIFGNKNHHSEKKAATIRLISLTLTNKNIDVDNQTFNDMDYESKFLIG